MKMTHTGAIIAAIATIVAAVIQTKSCGTTEKSSAEKVQVTTDVQSPIVTPNGDVNITYGVPDLIGERWTRILKARGYMDEEIQARLDELADDSRKLQATLAQRSSDDEASKVALQHLSQGDFSNAEARLRGALDNKIQARDF